MGFASYSSSIKGLNTKIITYFITFAFIPLFIFSILGYSLNKKMINKINSDNLRVINRYYAKSLTEYLDKKELAFNSELNKCKVNADPAKLEPCLENSGVLQKEFGSITFVEKTSKTNSVKVETPYLIHEINEKIDCYAILPVSELYSIIESDLPEIQHEIIVPELKSKLNSMGTTGFDDLAAVVHEYHQKSKDSRFGVFHGRENLEIYTFSLIPGVKWMLVSRVNSGYFYKDLDDFRTKIIAANVILALILISLAFVVSTSITSPIHKLVGAVQNIRSGNLDYKIELGSGDEVQLLAEEFELMRQRLQESYQNLENKIHERTVELKEAQSQITHQEKMASLGLMAAGIAHEIGNPLTSISSMAQMIRRKTSEENTQEFVSNILKNIDRISKIVRELVDFSRPSSYTAAMSNINEIINSAVGIVKYDRRSKHMNFNLSLAKDIPETYLVADQLLQVFINILINAVDASEGYSNEIGVKTDYKNHLISIEISDQGCGIAADKLNKVFEPFYTSKEVGKGTGLGLTVSYGIVKNLKGDIKVESEVGKGSKFIITLPLRKEE